jgi:hypothetical protein
MNINELSLEIASQLQAKSVHVHILPEYALANFVVLRPNEVKPTRFQPPLTTIQTTADDKIGSLATIIFDRIHVMLDSLKGFLDEHDYTAFVTLNKLDIFGADEIMRLAYQAAVIQKKSIIDVVTDSGYGSLQELHDNTLDKRY